MAATTTLFRAARPAFRQSAFGAHRAAFQSQRANAGRRWQSTSAGESQSFFSRMWNSPVGFKTVHFWAPVMKWALVLAGVSDFARPAEKLSLTQNGALTATGLIWTRWCFVIKPKNYLLAAVNFFLGVVGVIQVSRILMWKQSQKNAPLPDAAELKEEAKDKAVELKEGAEAKIEQAKSAIKSQ